MSTFNPKSFVYGFVFSVILFALYSFTQSVFSENRVTTAKNTVSLQPVDPTTALAYRNNYMTLEPNGIAAINISVQQWEAINQVVTQRNNDLTKVSGFRMYYGATSRNPDAEIVSIAYTLNENLEENQPAQSLPMADGFSRSFSQQCPPFCD